MFRLFCNSYSKPSVRYFHKASDYFPKFNNETPTTKYSNLKNDLQVVSENWGSEACTVGIWMSTGSRAETEKNYGITNFLQHMYLKGTVNKSHKDIQTETSERGAKWHTYTEREMSAIYVNCHKNDVEWAVNLLGEIVSEPKYDDNLVEECRKHVLKGFEDAELNYKDVVFDYLHATAYQGTPLGKSVLGNIENVKSFTSKDLHDFIIDRYKAPRMVLAATGDIDHESLTGIAQKHLEKISCNYYNGVPERGYCRYTGSDIRDRDDMLSLAHVIIAYHGPAASDPDNIPLLVSTAIYGSYDKTYGGTFYSNNQTAVTLFIEGNAHCYQNFIIPYHDTSLWGIYFAATKEELKPINEYFLQRIMKLCTNISDFEVNRAKNQLKAKMLLSMNGSSSICNELGRQMLLYGRRIPVDELIARINAVDANAVRTVCQKYIYDKCPAVAAYGPIEGMADYNNIRSSSYWLRY